jgi:Tfp pilus assembly protein PilN
VVRLSQVISEIAERKPQGLWLESVGTDGGKLLIKGTCVSNDVYANFIDNLSASPLVEWVTPSSIQRDSASGLFDFEVTGKVIGASAPASSENKKDVQQ